MIYTSHKYFLIESIIIGILILSMALSFEFFRFRHIVMIFSLSYIVFLSRQLRLSNLLLSFRKPSFAMMMRTSIAPSLVAMLGMLILYAINPLAFTNPAYIINFPGFPWYFPLVMYPLYSVPVQEIVFRWFYLSRVTLVVLKPRTAILLSALLFSLSHISMGNALVIGTFFFGLWWGYVYLQTKSLWPVILSHSMLGGLMIWLTLIRL